MAEIEFDPLDYIDEIDTDDLEKELKLRKDRKESRFAPIRETVTELTSAFYGRNADRFETLVRRLERQYDA